MPEVCSVTGCRIRHSRQSKLYSFPRYEDRLMAWLNNIGRIDAVTKQLWKPKPWNRVCFRHFVSGKPSKDPLNVDYLPTLSMGCSSKGPKEDDEILARVKNEDSTFESDAPHVPDSRVDGILSKQTLTRQKSVRQCDIPQCCSDQQNIPVSSIPLHQFKVWKSKIDDCFKILPAFSLTAEHKVCFLHFHFEDFVFSASYSRKIYSLREGAVPSFLNRDEVDGALMVGISGPPGLINHQNIYRQRTNKSIVYIRQYGSGEGVGAPCTETKTEKPGATLVEQREAVKRKKETATPLHAEPGSKAKRKKKKAIPSHIPPPHLMDHAYTSEAGAVVQATVEVLIKEEPHDLPQDPEYTYEDSVFEPLSATGGSVRMSETDPNSSVCQQVPVTEQIECRTVPAMVTRTVCLPVAPAAASIRGVCRPVHRSVSQSSIMNSSVRPTIANAPVCKSQNATNGPVEVPHVIKRSVRRSVTVTDRSAEPEEGTDTLVCQSRTVTKGPVKVPHLINRSVRQPVGVTNRSVEPEEGTDTSVCQSRTVTNGPVEVPHAMKRSVRQPATVTKRSAEPEEGTDTSVRQLRTVTNGPVEVPHVIKTSVRRPVTVTKRSVEPEEGTDTSVRQLQTATKGPVKVPHQINQSVRQPVTVTKRSAEPEEGTDTSVRQLRTVTNGQVEVPHVLKGSVRPPVTVTNRSAEPEDGRDTSACQSETETKRVEVNPTESPVCQPVTDSVGKPGTFTNISVCCPGCRLSFAVQVPKKLPPVVCSETEGPFKSPVKPVDSVNR